MEITRKLASIRTIREITPIPGADQIEVAHIDGWQCVVSKGKHQPGDAVAYFEIDSFLPVEPPYEFLRKGCFKTVEGLGEGFRIKTIRLRGQLSQGLVMGLGPLPEGIGYCGRTDPGTDLTELLGVQKYEKPIPAQLRGQMAGNFPSFIPKTDQKRVQNCFGKLCKDSDWELTIKLDGTSLTAYTHEGHIGVCSRNFELKDDGNAYWEAAKADGLIAALEKMRDAGHSIAFQGELMGQGIQGNREDLSEKQFFLYDVFDIAEYAYLDPRTRQSFALDHSLRHVPHFATCSIGHSDVPMLLAMADTKSLNHPVAEGLVWKRMDGGDSFKVINNKFLLSEKD